VAAKVCPYCAEEIQERAIKCRFCGSDLSARTPDQPSATMPGEGQASIESLRITGLTKGIRARELARLRNLYEKKGARFIDYTDGSLEGIARFAVAAATQSNGIPVLQILAVLAALIVVGVLWLGSTTEDNEATSIEQQRTRPPSVAKTEPDFVAVTLHPHDLLRNPFLYKGKRVNLDALNYPSVANGQVLNWNRGGVYPGWTGLRLNKMLSETEVLYNVMSLDMAEGKPEIEEEGQLVVRLPRALRDDEGLTVDSPWEVEPLGTFDGRSALGATISVPAVRFWRYAR
jgi:hypothetical protein